MRTISGVVLRTQPDEKLVALAGEGSDAAFEAIVNRYRRPLYAYCRRLLISDARSEDVVQQALLNAWSALQSGAEIRSAKAWLYRITHNAAIAALQKPGYDFEELHESVSASDIHAGELDRRILMRETLAAVAALPQRQQEVIVRTALQGQSYEEVADALGLSRHAVRGLAHRARTSVRAAVAAVTPAPVVVWAAGQTERSGDVQQWIAAMLGGGGAAGGAIAIKGAAIFATSAALVGGTVADVLRFPVPSRPAPHAVIARTPARARPAAHRSHPELVAAGYRAPAATAPAAPPAATITPAATASRGVNLRHPPTLPRSCQGLAPTLVRSPDARFPGHHA
jgi:RNA polymerase sigma factor (sigma-70 family)